LLDNKKNNEPKWQKIILPKGQKYKSIVSPKKYTKPKWLKVKLPTGQAYKNIRGLTKKYNLHTICESGNCPNMGECWGAGTATFMILGNICTRSCGFCNVKTGRPLPVDLDEPRKVAESVRIMKVKHAVITSVDRDELKDGGAGIWAQTINEIRNVNPETTMETLIPDFKGKQEDIQQIINASPEVVSHNMETVKRLTKKVRIQAKYDRSLDVLKYLSDNGMNTKSGIMLGLGEQEIEVVETMNDLRKVGVKIMTIGQYLQPTKKHLPVVDFISPDQFKKYQDIGLKLGFKHVESGPLVRSSYHAEKHIL
jgi:lipoic acid synthetase